MSMVNPLQPDALCRYCDPNQFVFESTAELEELSEIIGQKRAIEAVQFGISIRREGYNLYVLGPHSTGKHSSVRQFLEQRAASETTPDDWCYVNNFEQPHRPLALRLPSGQGIALCRDMETLITELRSAIPVAFEGEDYRARKQAIEEEFKGKQDAAFQNIQRMAKERGLALIRSASGLAFAPLKEGQVISPEAFQKLPEAERNRLESEVEVLQAKLEDAARQARKWEKDLRDRIKELDREIALLEVGYLIADMYQTYKDLPEVVAYLRSVQKDIIQNVDDFRPKEEAAPPAMMGIPLPRNLLGPPIFRRYQVNVLIDHSASQDTPVIYEDHPTYQNLVGRLEHIVAQGGALMTDFTLLKAGALHRANGGYLILDAHKILA
ncbi:MAG: AAA family ATPase, partial [Anaerolineae bacterium]